MRRTNAGTSRRLTRLHATIGPKITSARLLAGLVNAGIDGFRINASHASNSEIGRSMRLIDQLQGTRGNRLTTRTDLEGPRVRCSPTPHAPAVLEAGGSVRLTATTGGLAAAELLVSRSDFLGLLEPPDTLVLDRGRLKLQVARVGRVVVCSVVKGGRLRSGAALAVADRRLPEMAFLSNRDRAAIAAACDAGTDLIGLSMVRRARGRREGASPYPPDRWRCTSTGKD